MLEKCFTKNHKIIVHKLGGHAYRYLAFDNRK